MKENIKTKKWISDISRLVLLFLFAGMTVGLSYQLYIEETFSIYDGALRFHVRADSDEKKAQEQKKRVREGLLCVMEEQVKKAGNAKVLREDLEKRIRYLEEEARQILKKEGEEQAVKVFFVKERFPIKRYGSIFFPAGEYTALRVDIGEAKGHNWWCAIYPELCYNAEESMNLSQKGQKDLEGAVPEKEKEVLAGESAHFRFKILEWFSSLSW
ncbi:MAG: stage II sporulation protein R [Eubacteriales bacterium]|nr:stage II sporulation protein R [Eubacteriales bacterium]